MLLHSGVSRAPRAGAQSPDQPHGGHRRRGGLLRARNGAAPRCRSRWRSRPPVFYTWRWPTSSPACTAGSIRARASPRFCSLAAVLPSSPSPKIRLTKKPGQGEQPMENPDKAAGPTPVTPDGQRLADYEPAIGPNAAYYLPRFVEFDQRRFARSAGTGRRSSSRRRGSSIARCGCRACSMSSFRSLCDFLAGIAAAVLAGPVKAHPVLFAAALLLLLAVPWFVLPMFANAFYWRHVRDVDRRDAALLAQAPDKRAARLERRRRHRAWASWPPCSPSRCVLDTRRVCRHRHPRLPGLHDPGAGHRGPESRRRTLRPRWPSTTRQNEVWPEDSAAAGYRRRVSGKYVESVSVAERQHRHRLRRRLRTRRSPAKR